MLTSTWRHWAQRNPSPAKPIRVTTMSAPGQGFREYSVREGTNVMDFLMMEGLYNENKSYSIAGTLTPHHELFGIAVSAHDEIWITVATKGS